MQAHGHTPYGILLRAYTVHPSRITPVMQTETQRQSETQVLGAVCQVWFFREGLNLLEQTSPAISQMMQDVETGKTLAGKVNPKP